jgi:hypothetical protein
MSQRTEAKCNLRAGESTSRNRDIRNEADVAARLAAQETRFSMLSGNIW